VVNWLNTTALTVLGEPASRAELLGFVTGLWCVWLVVRQHIANWPVGIANSVMLLVAFLGAGLYADAWLQVVYVVLGGYGWWQWLRPGVRHARLDVRRTTRDEWRWLTVAGVVATGVLYEVLRTVSDSGVPFADAATTVISLVATYGQCRKLVESWWIWITVDMAYVPLYAYKHLYLTTVLYVVFGCLAVAGLLAWRRDLRAATDPPIGRTPVPVS
jgi:nicotinamide mononucleotide transporter